MDMNNQVRLLLVLLFSMALASGCEQGGAKSTDEFYVTPATVDLVPGQAVALTAVGGHLPLVWTVSDPTAGQLSSSNGQSVVYIALSGTSGTSNAVAAVMNTIRVTDGEDWTAHATIIQR
jgi:hypothetical protein